jgi:hypothetical protein
MAQIPRFLKFYKKLMQIEGELDPRDIAELKIREDYHSVVHPGYFIPDWPASSLSTGVLRDMAKHSSTYLKIPRIEVINISNRKNLVAKVPVRYMLDIFEQYLAKTGQKPTGINRASPPNKDFVCRIIYHMDPANELNLFREKKNRESLTSGLDKT